METLTQIKQRLPCPRCIGGQLFTDEYKRGNEVKHLFCIQCGYSKAFSQKEIEELTRRIA